MQILEVFIHLLTQTYFNLYFKPPYIQRMDALLVLKKIINKCDTIDTCKIAEFAIKNSRRWHFSTFKNMI